MSKLINKNGIRTDGRKVDELRPIKIEVGILKNADGSAYVEHGRNKIVAAVYGPKETHPKFMALPDKALLRCRYHMAPYSTEERKSPQPSRREIEISKVIRMALEPAVRLEEFPRTAIDIYIEVLQSDGGSRGASITAAAVALADAGIPMKDLVVGCAAGKVEGQIVLDLNDIEDKEGEVDLPIAMMPNSGKITLLQMDGILSPEEFEQALELAIDGCKKIHEIQREALYRKYFGSVEAKKQ